MERVSPERKGPTRPYESHGESGHDDQRLRQRFEDPGEHHTDDGSLGKCLDGLPHYLQDPANLQEYPAGRAFSPVKPLPTRPRPSHTSSFTCYHGASILLTRRSEFCIKDTVIEFPIL